MDALLGLEMRVGHPSARTVEDPQSLFMIGMLPNSDFSSLAETDNVRFRSSLETKAIHEWFLKNRDLSFILLIVSN